MAATPTLTSPAGRLPIRPPLDPRPSPVRWRWVLGVLAVVVAVSTAIVVVSGIRPSYDGFGFLIWGRRVLHWNLNTDGAPSWKPLPFLFTLPYALVGVRAQMWLWMVTATAGAFGSAVFAGRAAARLTGPSPGAPYAPVAAGAFAAVGVLGIGTLSHLVVIANSDPLIVALCLGAVDSHLAGRPRLAFAMLVLASLGRPEAWALAGLYGLWAVVRVPGWQMRLLVVLGWALIPAFWFTIPALTSHSWFISGDLALNQHTVIHGNKLLGVLGRLRSLYELPMQLAVLCGVVLAVLRRDRATLLVVAAALLWVAIEVVFAYHGWSAVARYMIEPAALLVVVAGTAVGRLLAGIPGRPALGWLRWVGLIAVCGLVAALVPVASGRVRTTRVEVVKARESAARLNRLTAIIDRDGIHRIRSCGQPVSYVGLQSTLAWELDMNVGDVGYNPGHAIGRGRPIVVFKPRKLGWQVRPYNLPPARAADCDRLRADGPR